MNYQQEHAKNRLVLRLLTRSRMKFQDVRKACDSQVGRKANGKDQNLPEDRMTEIASDRFMFIQIADSSRQQEKEIEKMQESVLKKFAVYNEWLSKIKGIGTVGAGWMIGEFDIFIATTVSKMWQFAGFNPGMVFGRKAIKKDKYKPDMGEIVKDLPDTKDGKKRIEVRTTELIRGDKATPGFLLPYNKNLRVALIGIVGDGFIKQQNEYAMNYYYPYKNRLENSDRIVKEVKKGGKVIEIPWSEAKKGHRDSAAKRYMMKNFLKDLYANWREIEGLPVRAPYAEEYLGKVHEEAV